MEFVFAVQNEQTFARYQKFADQYQDALTVYIDWLQKRYQAKDLPRCIVLADARTACELISDIPVPAYTNDYRIVFTPELETWREIYLRQLDSYEKSPETEEIRAYYENVLNERYLLQILGHELAHHSDLFSDEAYENGNAWFEEGAVEYISRKYFLTPQEFEMETRINQALVALYERTHPARPLTAFGDTDNFATLYYDYWRAFLKIRDAADRLLPDFPGQEDAVNA